MEILNVLQQELVQILSLKRLSLNGVLERLATRGYAAHSDILNALRSVAFTDNKDKYVLQPNLFLLSDPEYEGYTIFERKVMQKKMFQIRVKALSGKTLQQRVMHTIAPGGLSYKSLTQRLREEGSKHTEEALIQLLQMITDMDATGRHCLRSLYYNELDAAWPGWGRDERRSMQTLLAFNSSINEITEMMGALKIADPTFRGGKRSREEEDIQSKRRRQV